MIIFLREKFIAQLFMWVIAIVFLVGTVLLYNNSQGGSGGPEAEVVLRMGDAEVTRGDFERAVADAMRAARNQQRFGGEPDRGETQKSVIKQWIQQTILSSATVSDAEVERYIRSDADRVSLYNLYQQRGFEDIYGAKRSLTTQRNNTARYHPKPRIGNGYRNRTRFSD